MCRVLIAIMCHSLSICQHSHISCGKLEVTCIMNWAVSDLILHCGWMFFTTQHSEKVQIDVQNIKIQLSIQGFDIQPKYSVPYNNQRASKMSLDINGNYIMCFIKYLLRGFTPHENIFQVYSDNYHYQKTCSVAFVSIL